MFSSPNKLTTPKSLTIFYKLYFSNVEALCLKHLLQLKMLLSLIEHEQFGVIDLDRAKKAFGDPMFKLMYFLLRWHLLDSPLNSGSLASSSS